MVRSFGSNLISAYTDHSCKLIDYMYMVHSTGSGGLQLFVGKDGKAVLGSTARTTVQLARPVSGASSTSKTLSVPDS